MSELYANNVATTLASPCDDNDLTITVLAAAPAALQGGQFRVAIDAELLLVTAGQDTTTWTVTRGIEGTTAAAHVGGATVAHVLTAAGLSVSASAAADALAAQMGAGGVWASTLDGTANSGQKVVPVTSTTGAVAGMPVYIGLTSGTHEVGVIDTISAGVSVTLVANLTSTYAAGTPISATPAEVADARGGYATLGQKVRGQAFDVRDYGAVGDGVTDDTAAIQAAATAAAGNVLFFPPGVYAAAGLAITSGTTVWGYGATIQNNAPATITSYTADASNVRVYGLTFDGNATTQVSAVRFTRCTGTVLVDCTATRGLGSGFDIRSGDVSFTRCVGHTNGRAGGPVGAGFYIIDDGAGGGTPSVRATDCIGHDNGLGVGLDGSGFHVAKGNVEVVNFTGYSNTRYGVKHQDPAGSGRYTNVHVYSNPTGFSVTAAVNVSIDGLYAHDHPTGYGLWLDAGCRYITVTGYLSVGNYNGIRIEATSADITVTNAILRDSVHRSVDAASGASAVSLVNVVSWNPGAAYTSANDKAGFYLAGSDNVTLIGCSARDTRTAGTGAQHYGFYLSTATNVRMAGCRADAGETRFGSIYAPTSYADRTSGTATIATGATIAHGLSAAPTKFGVMSTTSAGAFCTADATNLTVTFIGGGSQVIKWWAEA
jgi:hypothetical protein